MEFVWNDGGRAASGFVGLAGDCVTRAIAIASGSAYRDVYNLLGEASQKSPRSGMSVTVAEQYLLEHGWESVVLDGVKFTSASLPKGVLVAHISKMNNTAHHFSAVIDHVVHDTWNASEDEYILRRYWLAPTLQTGPAISTIGTRAQRSHQSELTQQEFEKIIRRLRALDNTASNAASTEGEKHNALRMMQDLLLRHNLTHEDIVEKEDAGGLQLARMACPLNSARATTWEVMLASYVTTEFFATVQWYSSRRGHRTFFWFYGPVIDVENCILLFRELLMTIASAARLQYGGFARGSGASYCEGYVRGLPRASQGDVAASKSDTQQQPQHSMQQQLALVQSRAISLKQSANQWLAAECHIHLVNTHRGGRDMHDPAASERGRIHGASHKLNVPGSRKRLN